MKDKNKDKVGKAIKRQYELLPKQKQYLSEVRSYELQYAEAVCLNDCMKEEKDGVIKMLYMGIPMPIYLAQAKYNALVHNLKEIIASMESKKQDLLKDFTEEQLEALKSTGKYITE